MHIFYTPDIRNQESYILPASESRHCIRVLRLKKNSEVQLVDGLGNLYSGTICEPDPGGCKIVVSKVIPGYHKRNFHLHIAIAPTKSTDRFEWFLEKVTEIGIDEITLLLCSRSERTSIRPERIEKVIVAAMKQSVIALKPVINEFTDIGYFIRKEAGSHTRKFIAHCKGDERQNISRLYKPQENVVCLVGPEGDFSTEEIDLATENQYHPITLGINRLRTETAGVVACAIFNFLNENP